MTHYDDAVRSALSAEDAELYDALGRSQNPVQAAFATMSGGRDRRLRRARLHQDLVPPGDPEGRRPP